MYRPPREAAAYQTGFWNGVAIGFIATLLGSLVLYALVG